MKVQIEERLIERIGVREWGPPTLRIPGQIWRSAKHHHSTETSMLKILIAIALEINSIHRVNVDLIELNHQHSTDGLIKFDQVIIWKWSPDYRRYDAQHWFIPHRPTEFPTKTGSLYQCSAPDPTTTIFQSKLYRRTHQIRPSYHLEMVPRLPQVRRTTLVHPTSTNRIPNKDRLPIPMLRTRPHYHHLPIQTLPRNLD